MNKKQKVTKPRGKKIVAHTVADAFHVIDGSVIMSIQELADHLEWMSDDTFYYHVTPEKNDFATWIEHAVGEKELANTLFEIKDKFHTETAILRYIIKKLS